MKNRILLALVCLMSLCTIAANAQEDGNALLAHQRIAPSYSLTETGFGSADRVTKAGSVYVFRIDGLFARPVVNNITPTNTIKDGALVNPAKGFLGAIGTSGDAQQVKPGDRFYLHEINIDSENVSFTFISLDTVSSVYRGRSRQSRLRLYVKFPVPKNGLSSVDPDAMHKLTDPIFVPESDPAASAAVTVQLGQTLEQVKKIMGEPLKVMDMGAKQILIYREVKVTLVDGKVTDAQ